MRHTGRHWIALLAAGSLTGCAGIPPVRVLTPTDQHTRLEAHSPFLKAHMRDGRLCVLSAWKVDDAARAVTGRGALYAPDRRLLEAGELRVALDQVALFETNVPTHSVAIAPLAVVTGLSVVLTAYCVVNPKACFGSCPTFYAGEGDERLLLAEGFSDSVAPALEATDLDALYRARPRERRFVLEMTNEALETHVVRYVDLWAARRPAGGRVLAGADDRLWNAGAPQAPVVCQAEEGDCVDALSTADGRERFSRTDGKDLAQRESLELEFESDAGQASGLVIGARQTLLSTYLLYQTLSYMGQDAGYWLAQVERGNQRVKGRAAALREALGGIEVSWQRADGAWARVAEIRETGPLASDVKVVPLPRSHGVRTRVRLRLTRGLWRLDLVALAPLLGPAKAERLSPVTVVGPGQSQATDAAGLAWPVTTLPGDRYAFTFELPEEPETLELFLQTRGYYLEWMRDEWLREESPQRLRALLRDPRRALRELAPEFQAREPDLEDAFWRSRYALHP